MRDYTEEKKLAEDIARAINSFGFGYEEFCKAMTSEHRTLQQSFTRLCIYWLKTCAELEEYQYDGRNEASVMLGKIVMDALEQNDIHGVPMI